MVIAYSDEEVGANMREAVEYSQERPVLVDHFLENAIESTWTRCAIQRMF